ncbi:MAG: hypothetical protein Q9226_008300, partial [Calogaya cf. arnoldii]
CAQGFRSIQDQHVDRWLYKAKISDSEAQALAASHITSINCDREILRQRCSSYGNTIMSRWKKKSRSKRHGFLLEIEPELYPHMWFQPRLGSEVSHWREGRKYRIAWLLPYLSLEVLETDPVRLLSLLYNRSHYTPEQWATFDSRQLNAAWNAGFTTVDHSPKCIVMHGYKYGSVVPWEKEQAHRMDIVGFPRGNMVLEAQSFLLRFLRKVVEHLLEGIDLNSPGASEKWTQMTSSGFRQTDSVEFWSPYLNQPFCAPPIFDVDALVSLARTRLELAEDHIWLLQTDPAYIRQYFKSLSAGAHGEALEATPMIASNLVRDAQMCFFWQSILEECENVKRLYWTFRDSIYPGERLPQKFDRGLGALRLVIVTVMDEHSEHLNAFVPDRPGFRDAWINDYSCPGEVRQKRAKEMPAEKLYVEDRLDWLMLQLLGPPERKGRYDHAMLFALLDDHLSKSPAAEKARLDQTLYDKLSDLAAMHELLVAVRLHRPMSADWSPDDLKKTEDRNIWKMIDVDADAPTIGHEERRAQTEFLGKRVKAFLDVPPPTGKQDLAWLEQSQKAREALSMLWASIRANREATFRFGGVPADDIEANLDILRADSSPEYIAVVQEARVRILAKIHVWAAKPTNMSAQTVWESKDSPKSTSLPLREQPKTKTRPEQPNIDTRPEQPKMKTRLEQAATNEADEKGTDTATTVPSKDRPMVPLTQQSINILSNLFPAEKESAPKTVDWNAFVQAMADAKFVARHSGGSAVTFEKQGSSSGKIVFHRPHPVAKIGPVMFHCMGRRMNKWFGWGKDTFCVAS